MHSLGLTLRPAFPDDREAVARLAALDSAPVPPDPLLVAEIGGELIAALSLTDSTVIADPFHRTREIVALLRTRAQQLSALRRSRVVGWSRLRPRATALRF